MSNKEHEYMQDPQDKLRLAADNEAKRAPAGVYRIEDDPQFSDEFEYEPEPPIMCPKCKQMTDPADPCCGDDRDYNEMLRDAADLERDSE